MKQNAADLYPYEIVCTAYDADMGRLTELAGEYGAKKNCLSGLPDNMGMLVYPDEKMGMEADRMGELNVLEVNHLYRDYQQQAKDCTNVLKGLNFLVKKGDFIGVMGKSGCGKTTLLKVLGMIDKQTSGTLKFMGQDTGGLNPNELADIRRKQIGFVFQDFYLMDCMSVKENIILPMILDKEPCALSGGQKQRVAICRALVNNPDLILADEPTGNLDSKSGRIVIEALLRINREYEKTAKTSTDEKLYQLILERMDQL